MTSPFQMPHSAFEPFFDERVAYSATRPDGVHRGTVPASVLDGPFDEPLADEATSTSRRTWSVTVRKTDFAAVLSSPPQEGDVLTLTPAGELQTFDCTVSAVRSDIDFWTLDAREVSP